MKKLKKEEWLYKHSWVQTIAAILAIPSAIIAFIIFFRKDENLQKQINKLEAIAIESKHQTKLLEAERDSLTNRWRLQILPVFEIECNEYNGGYSEIEAFLVNSGKIATDIKVINSNGFSIEDIQFKSLGEGMKGKIFLNFKNTEILAPENVDLDLTLSFKDASGTICFQKILIKEFGKSVQKRMKVQG